MENELKYIYTKDQFQNFYLFLIKDFQKNGFVLTRVSPKEQIDYYYDTSNYTFLQLHESLRIREKEHHFKGTYKRNANINQSYLAREEIEFEIPTLDISLVLALLKKKKIEIAKDLHLALHVYNNREDVMIEKNGYSFCVSFDSVTYYHESTGKIAEEQMIEIEAKDGFSEELFLEIDRLCQKHLELTMIQESKYERGMHQTSCSLKKVLTLSKENE